MLILQALRIFKRYQRGIKRANGISMLGYAICSAIMCITLNRPVNNASEDT